MNDADQTNCHHPLFLDMIRMLQKAEDNDTAIHVVMDMVAGVFHPDKICFVPGGPDEFKRLGDCGPWAFEVQLLPDQMIKLLPSKAGFAMGLKRQGRRIGMLIAENVSQPRELNSMVPLLLIIPDALEMAFSNIRYHQQLDDARLRQSQLSESLGVANKILRHDIANELLVIGSSLELYKMNNREKDLLRAQNALLRTNNIIKQMKDLDSFLLSHCDLAATGLKQTIDRSLSVLEMAYTVEGDATVLADPALTAVIENLVRNAKKHGKAKRMEFTVKRQESLVKLVVRDDGTGIPEENLARILMEGVGFGESRGTGLGLYLVKRTMERYGGSISVGNDPRGGARFELTFRSA
ncbi:MAG: HAMP domain-containing histidine kinase [Methanomassiliicoccales archaeon]|nr:HAMP domain-containing histidine kinase [Methanomassiliicoccales archaeon]